MKLFLLKISDFLLQRKFKKTFVYSGVEIDIVSVLKEAKNRLHLKYPNERPFFTLLPLSKTK